MVGFDDALASAHVGAVVVPLDFKNWPELPFASLVPVPLAPPYIKSPPVVIGLRESKASVLVDLLVPPFITGNGFG